MQGPATKLELPQSDWDLVVFHDYYSYIYNTEEDVEEDHDDWSWPHLRTAHDRCSPTCARFPPPRPRWP
eukprot:1936675-Alexandrium_andersonii.AAC.1